MYKHICNYCGKDFENTNKNSKFCSNDCKHKASSKKIECACDNCNKIVFKKRDEYEKNTHHFCSQKCHYEFKSMGEEEIICLNCGKKKTVLVKDHRKFCSYECAMQYNAKKTCKLILEDETRKIICKNCNKEFVIFPSDKDKNKYLCSIECKVEWLKNNLYNKNEYKEKQINRGRQSFYKKYNKLDTNVELIGQYVNAKTKISCKCKIHNDSFFDILPSHIIEGKTGCKSCFSQKSKNEDIINSFLSETNYNYIRQKTFIDCKYINLLPFDFYLTDFKLVIEYDGEHHYKPIPRGNMTQEEAENEFRLIKIRDDIKTKYCKDNNIKLIRIPYWEQDNILHFLWDELVKYDVIIEKNN